MTCVSTALWLHSHTVKHLLECCLQHLSAVQCCASRLVLLSWKCECVCRSFAGEALERERFTADVVASYKSGLSFAKAKSNVESLNRFACSASVHLCNLYKAAVDLPMHCQHILSPLDVAQAFSIASVILHPAHTHHIMPMDDGIHC